MSFYLPEVLWSNQVETDRLGTLFTMFLREVKIPDDLRRELLWPSHIPLPSLEDPTGDEPNVDDEVSSLLTPLGDPFPSYLYDPRHMLCAQCLGDVLRSKFWSWWEVHRKLPPVSAPDQPNCSGGYDCVKQLFADHAAQYNVSSLYGELPFPVLSILTDFVSTGVLTPGGCNHLDLSLLLPLHVPYDYQ